MSAQSELKPVGHLKSIDPIWDAMRLEADTAAKTDPVLAAFMYSTVINARSLEDCVIYRICERCCCARRLKRC
jgi:serine O-acetyltransferase